MGTNYWMFVETAENASITREMGYKLFGMGPRYRKRAQRMQKNDRVLFYTRTSMNWTATATITSECFKARVRPRKGVRPVSQYGLLYRLPSFHIVDSGNPKAAKNME